jgi:hypothetical protein
MTSAMLSATALPDLVVIHNYSTIDAVVIVLMIVRVKFK